MSENLRGEFEIEVDGVTYQTKCNFALIEALERKILKRSILQATHDAMNGNIYYSEMVDIIHAAMQAAKDNRLNRADLGEKIHKDGFDKHIAWYIEFMTYALTGKTKEDTEIVEDSDDVKKKSK